MAEARKRGSFNERVKIAHERKVWVEENKRIERMQLESAMTQAQKRKRHEARLLVAFAAGIAATTGFSTHKESYVKI
jgi:uncharacterized protein (DUF2345 family)